MVLYSSSLNDQEFEECNLSERKCNLLFWFCGMIYKVRKCVFGKREINAIPLKNTPYYKNTPPYWSPISNKGGYSYNHRQRGDPLAPQARFFWMLHLHLNGFCCWDLLHTHSPRMLKRSILEAKNIARTCLGTWLAKKLPTICYEKPMIRWQFGFTPINLMQWTFGRSCSRFLFLSRVWLSKGRPDLLLVFLC